MRWRHSQRIKQRLAFLIVLGISLFWMPRAFDNAASDAATPHRVHIAFGFHVNLYHSFRGDTNDENGFGQDIRVIRHTLRVLDDFDRRGIRVPAVWDFDGLFSLQEILPAHAPDIIAEVQRRVREDGDDVMLMSYNNGLMSAMTDREFRVSMQRAISNPDGSGVRDLFGRVAPVVRPQEMMTTPGNFDRYRRLGIDAVSLYYSATPFDGFRMFSRVLDPAEAHNPITYTNPASGETITILPTYHAGDLVENVSLRHWARRLHDQQMAGSIDRDVLIFINFDADAEFWTGGRLPAALKWLPNTGGIGQLIESVADLDFVTFSNVSDYLADHLPVGTVQFGQDTADGSFNGYHSWAEKAGTAGYWTRIERNRRVHRNARKMQALAQRIPGQPALDALMARSFETRLRALSTTHFGLATPFLARPRQAAMDALMARLDGYSDQIEVWIAAVADGLIEKAASDAGPVRQGRLIDTFVHLESDAGGDRLLSFHLPSPVDGDSDYRLIHHRGRQVATQLDAVDTESGGENGRITLRIAGAVPMPDGVYRLYAAASDQKAPLDRHVHADTRRLDNGILKVVFDDSGHVSAVYQNGVRQLEADSLLPAIVHNGSRLQPSKLAVTVTADGSRGVGEVRLHGAWEGPAGRTRAPGRIDYRLRLVRGEPYLFIDGRLRYPDTRRDAIIQADKPVLARKIDDDWQSVTPAELRFAPRARENRPFVVQKHNYLGQASAYAVDYFRHALENRTVADINNHITDAYAGVTTGGRGMAVAMNTAVKANFAFCPFQMQYDPASGDFAVRANPFGTYHGDQLRPPTRGNGLGWEAVLLSAPQLHSAAPTYNGLSDRFELMVAFFDSDSIPGSVQKDLIAFARRPTTVVARPAALAAPPEPADLPPAGVMALADAGAVLLHWEGSASPGTRYRISCRSADGAWKQDWTVTGETLRIDRAELPDTAPILATVQAIMPDGRQSPLSPAIRFRNGPAAEPELDIPPRFMARVLWSNMAAWVRQHLL